MKSHFRFRQRLCAAFLFTAILSGSLSSSALAAASPEEAIVVEAGDETGWGEPEWVSDDGIIVLTDPSEDIREEEPSKEPPAVSQEPSEETGEEPEQAESSPAGPENDGEDSVSAGEGIVPPSQSLPAWEGAEVQIGGDARETGTLKFTQHRDTPYYNVFAGQEMPFPTATIDGKLAYCVEPSNGATHSGPISTITWDGLTVDQQYLVGHIMLYGETSVSNVPGQAATQCLIWEVCSGRIDPATLEHNSTDVYDGVIGYIPAAAPRYEEILKKVKEHEQVPSFLSVSSAHAPVHQMEGVPGEYEYVFDNTNASCDLNEFHFPESGPLRFEQDGRKLTVTAEEALEDPVLVTAYKGAQGKTNSLIYWQSGSDQVRATGDVLAPVPAYMYLTTKDAEAYSLEISKVSLGTEKPLAGAVFEVRHVEKGVIGTVVTGSSGKAFVNLPYKGGYLCEEISPPKDHLLSEDSEQEFVIDAGRTEVKLTFANEPYTSILVEKVDKTTKEALAGAKIRLEQIDGSQVLEGVTDSRGQVLFTGLKPGTTWRCTEESAPDGFHRDETVYTLEAQEGETTRLVIENQRKTGLWIRKLSAAGSIPLKGAVFSVKEAGGALIGEFETDENGLIFVDGLSGMDVEIKEEKAPEGYLLGAEGQKVVHVSPDRDQEVVFYNEEAPSLLLKKISMEDGSPLEGAVIRVAYEGGAEFIDVTSGPDGTALLEGMRPGWVEVTELRSPDGFLLDSTPHRIQLTAGQQAELILKNSRKPVITIRKTDRLTRQPMENVTFRISVKNGRVLGEFQTDKNGEITLSVGEYDLEPGLTLVIEEIRTLEGYQLDSTLREVTLKGDESQTVFYENMPLNPIVILKKDSQGRAVPGAKFKVTKVSGEYVGEYTTGIYGYAVVAGENVEPGYFLVTETQAAPGFLLDRTPKLVHLTYEKPAEVEFINLRETSFQFRKVDSVTGKGLAGVRISIAKPDGEKVGQGEYVTDQDGYVTVTGLDPRETPVLVVTELEALPGYQPDREPRLVELKEGETAVLQMENKPYPILELLKTDEKGKPLSEVKFRLLDENKRELGTFSTNSRGRITITGIPGETTVYWQEAEALPGYTLDRSLHRIRTEWGAPAKITIKNEKIFGRVEIQKEAADASLLAKTEAGAPLAGAEFQIRDSRGRVVDTLTTGTDGKAVSKPLPCGEYTGQESSAPDFFLLNSKTFSFSITEDGQLIRVIVRDESKKPEVYLEKRGNTEAQPGQLLPYTLSQIQNKSNCSLDNFYVEDVIPTDAVRLQTIHTGTYNEILTYRVLYKTNLYPEYKVLAEDLSSQIPHTLSCSSQSLGLAANEYVTAIRFQFGRVQEGFANKTNPVLETSVLPDLPGGRRIVNSAVVSGTCDGTPVYHKSTWVTVTIPNTPERTLPKTGLWI